jgi:hypothetical protein
MGSPSRLHPEIPRARKRREPPLRCLSPAWKAGCSEREGADRGSPDIRTGARASHQAFDIFPSPAHLISPLPPIYLLLVAEQRRNGDVPFQAGYRSGRSAATVLPTLST